MPRPVEYTEQKIRAILSDIENGMKPASAAQANGMPLSTHNFWMSQGKKAEESEEEELTEAQERYLNYRSRILEAKDKGKRYLHDKVVQIAVQEGHSSTLLDLLGRLHPKEYGKGTGEMQRMKERLRVIEAEYAKHRLIMEQQRAAITRANTVFEDDEPQPSQEEN